MRWIIFDYGNVISRCTAALPSLARMLGASPEEFEAAYNAERDRYDRGWTDEEYWRAVGARLGAEVDGATARRLAEADLEGWSQLVPETLQLIDELHEAGARLALLSNAPSSFGRRFEEQDWARRFEHLVFSGDLRLAKPDAGIWQALLAATGAGAEECLFFDDRQDNIDGARRAGLRAELWRGAPDARRALREHGLPRARGLGGRDAVDGLR